MQDLGLYRALAGGAGLASCIALLADHGGADTVEFVAPAPVAIAALHTRDTLPAGVSIERSAPDQGRLTDSLR